MTYRVEVFDKHGLKLGYAYRGRLKMIPHSYPHPSSGRVAAAAYERHHPEHHCFVNKSVALWRS